MITILILIVVYILSGVICHYIDKRLKVDSDPIANWIPLLNTILATLGIIILTIVNLAEILRNIDRE